MATPSGHAVTRRGGLLAVLGLSMLTACGSGNGSSPEAPPAVTHAAPQTAAVQTGGHGQDRSSDPLRGIGYLGGTEQPRTNELVSVYERTRTFEGVNFFTSGHAPEALLMDMDGKVLHRWHGDFNKIFPKLPPEMTPEQGYAKEYTTHFRRAYLFPTGEILAIFDGFGLVKLDKGSNVLWAKLNGAHHDLDVAPDGRIWVVTQRCHIVADLNPTIAIHDDFIKVLDPGGNELRSISLLSCLRRSNFPIDRSKITEQDTPPSILHTNALEILDGRPIDATRRLSRSDAPVAGRAWVLPGYPNNPFRKGNLLTSFRASDMIAVVDPEIEKVVWAMAGSFKAQHEPTLLENGHLLLFDNLGGGPNRSRVLEIRPLTGEIVWQYTGSADRPFFSQVCGTAARLPNGNTLISSSVRGRVFEVTPESDIVWEFNNPLRAGDRHQFVAMIYQMIRLPTDFPLAWLHD